MKLEEVIAYFRTSYNMEVKFGINHVNMVNWKKLGHIPIRTQMKIERITNGDLKADLSHCPKV